MFSFKQGEWLKYVQEWYNQSCLFKFWFCILMVKKNPDLNSEYKHFWRICSGNIVWEENIYSIMSWSLHVCFRHQSLQFNLLYLLFSLPVYRRYYKEEEELVLDVGPFAKALEVLKTMNNVVYIYSYTCIKHIKAVHLE